MPNFIVIIPPRENIEKIFRIYDNKCANINCFKIIIDSQNHVNGNILFIESNKKDSYRFNPNLSSEELTDITNLMLFCDIHALEVEYDKDSDNLARLKARIREDLKNLPDSNFEFSDKLYEDFLHHFIDYHDPKRFSNFKMNAVLDPNDKFSPGGNNWIEYSISNTVIKPTRHFKGGKFEIIDYKRKFREYDKVVFYPKDITSENGVQADIEIKSHMRIEGYVPHIPKGDYFVSVQSALDETKKLKEDLSFTVL